MRKFQEYINYRENTSDIATQIKEELARFKEILKKGDTEFWMLITQYENMEEAIGMALDKIN